MTWPRNPGPSRRSSPPSYRSKPEPEPAINVDPQSENSARVQPDAVLAVQILNVAHIPVAQEQERGPGVHLIVVLGAQRRLFNLTQQLLMGVAMLGRAGKTLLLQQLLLTGEVHAGELD